MTRETIIQDRQFDRARQDVGNLVFLEHVNVRVPDQRLARLFYVVGLGFTRDPYLMVGVDNMWINMGQTQFHLPTGTPQRLAGHADLVVPDPDGLMARLDEVKADLAGTAFSYAVEGETVAVTCPWGNRYRCHARSPEPGGLELGLARVEVPVAPDHAAGVARFYREVLGAPAEVTDAGRPAARVPIGGRQALVFRETAGPLAAYDGHHVAVYLADFSGPHRRLAERGLVTQESSEHQYRFQDLVDLDGGRVLCSLEHEVRSLTHPLYRRPLVNRNPSQRQRAYVPGRDAWVPAP